MSDFWHKMTMPKRAQKIENFEPKDVKSVQTQPKLEHILFVLTKYKQNELLLIFRRHYILEI